MHDDTAMSSQYLQALAEGCKLTVGSFLTNLTDTSSPGAAAVKQISKLMAVLGLVARYIRLKAPFAAALPGLLQDSALPLLKALSARPEGLEILSISVEVLSACTQMEQAFPADMQSFTSALLARGCHAFLCVVGHGRAAELAAALRCRASCGWQAEGNALWTTRVCWHASCSE